MICPNKQKLMGKDQVVVEPHMVLAVHSGYCGKSYLASFVLSSPVWFVNQQDYLIIMF